MLTKRNFSIVLGALLLPLSMYAAMQDVVRQLVINLPFIEMPSPLPIFFGFFYFKFLGILNSVRIFDLLLHFLVFVGCSVIQAYTLHRLLKVPCTKAVPRMLAINAVTSLVLFLRHLKVFANFFIPDYQSSMFLLRSFFIAMLLFALQVIMVYFMYLCMDSLVNKRKLMKSLILAILLSFTFLLIVHVIQNWQSFSRILNS